MIRNSCGDVGVLVLFLLHSARLVDIRGLIDNGTGKNCRIIDPSTTGLPVLECQPLSGIHAFSGNDLQFFLKR